MRDHEDKFRQAGAVLAAIGLGDMHYARLFREEARISFPLLVDDQRTAYRAAGLRSGNLFHLLRRDNSEARARAQAAGHRQHRLGKNPFQLGASFIFARGNRDLFTHLNRTFGDDANLEALLSILETNRRPA